MPTTQIKMLVWDGGLQQFHVLNASSTRTVEQYWRLGILKPMPYSTNELVELQVGLRFSSSATSLFLSFVPGNVCVDLVEGLLLQPALPRLVGQVCLCWGVAWVGLGLRRAAPRSPCQPAGGAQEGRAEVRAALPRCRVRCLQILVEPKLAEVSRCVVVLW